MSIEVKETDREDKQWTDDADIVKHLTEIHTKNADLSEDFVLFQGTEEQKEFTRNQMGIARSVKDFIQDKTIAKETAQSLMKECENLAILERNKPENWLVKELVHKDVEAQPDEPKGMNKVMDKLFGEKGQQ